MTCAKRSIGHGRIIVQHNVGRGPLIENLLISVQKLNCSLSFQFLYTLYFLHTFYFRPQKDIFITPAASMQPHLHQFPSSSNVRANFSLLSVAKTLSSISHCLPHVGARLVNSNDTRRETNNNDDDDDNFFTSLCLFIARFTRTYIRRDGFCLTQQHHCLHTCSLKTKHAHTGARTR